MPKIKCPHCGANNQDVTEKDPCWSCEKVLGAPPVVAAEPAAPAAPIATPVQKQVEAPPPPTTAPASQGLSSTARIAITMVVVLVLIIIVCLVLKK